MTRAGGPGPNYRTRRNSCAACATAFAATGACAGPCLRFAAAVRRCAFHRKTRAYPCCRRTSARLRRCRISWARSRLLQRSSFIRTHARTHMHDPARSRRKVCTRALRMCAVARVRACACVRVCGCSLTCTSISSRRWRMQWMSACRSVCTPWGNLGCRGCHAKPNEHGSAWLGMAWLGMACAWCHAHSLHFQVTEDRSDGVLINTCGWVDGDGFKTQAWVALSNAMPAWCWCVCLCKFANLKTV